ncbi:MAG: NAD(P)-binding protein [Lachnospiraceae bacterium]|nr:NAD(P)-binding protein [Lachnospiraceae bacterium]
MINNRGIIMELEEARAFTDGCIYDDPAPCALVCPLELNIRSFLKKAAKGRWPGAYKELRNAVVFPEIVRDFCDNRCMERCQRKLLGDEPVDVAGLEAAVIKHAGEQQPEFYSIPDKNINVAVIGAGVAGLSLALSMAQKKYAVTVFDEREGWGGVLRDSASFEKYDADIKSAFSLEKLDFRFNTKVTDLTAIGDCAALYIATGENGEDFGLKETLNKEDFTVNHKNTFMAGGIIGMNVIESIAVSKDISRMMEGIIQTGKAVGAAKKPKCWDYRLIPDDTEPAARVIPANPDEGYDKTEAKAEAARCAQCTCDKCLKNCELMDFCKKPPQQCAMEVHGDNGPHFLASRTMTRTTYSCNLCGYCKQICPEDVDMGALYHFSRVARVKDGIAPEALHDYWLRELEFTRGEGFFASAPKGKETAKRVFFPGCMLTQSMPDVTKKTFEALAADGETGIILGCCGAPAYWAGDEEKQNANKKVLKDAWEKLGKPVFVLACASCLKMFKELYPGFETVTVYEALNETKGLSVTPTLSSATLFDPCASRGEDKMQSAVRKLLSDGGITVNELSEKGKCCGYGGHIRTANPKLYDEIVENRIKESEDSYYVYCANCKATFEEKGKKVSHVLECLFGESNEKYNLQQKRDNVLSLKKELMMELSGETFEKTSNPWDDIKLVISDEVREHMDQKLILDDDIKECIYNSVKENDRFTDGDGKYLACLIKRVMTYWAEYKEAEPDTYEVTDAYCHRMRFGDLEG